MSKVARRDSRPLNLIGEHKIEIHKDRLHFALDTVFPAEWFYSIKVVRTGYPIKNVISRAGDRVAAELAPGCRLTPQPYALLKRCHHL